MNVTHSTLATLALIKFSFFFELIKSLFIVLKNLENQSKQNNSTLVCY
jgi:hypothetical protein